MYFFFSYDERLLSALNFVLMFASSLSILALSPSYEQQMMGRQFFWRSTLPRRSTARGRRPTHLGLALANLVDEVLQTSVTPSGRHGVSRGARGPSPPKPSPVFLIQLFGALMSFTMYRHSESTTALNTVVDLRWPQTL